VAIHAGLAARFISAHVSEDLSNILVDETGAVSCGIGTFRTSQALALSQELLLERALIGNVVMEVVAGDVDDELAVTAVPRRPLTLDARCLDRWLWALSNVLASLTS